MAERRDAVRPIPRRVLARAYAPRPTALRLVAAPPYPDAPLPVGRVAGPPYGARNPIFEDGDDRTRRIARAQAAGYLVMRARFVRFPDGRVMRSYGPYDDD